LEGRLNVFGPANVASAMGDTVSLIQAQQGSTSLQGVDNFTLAGTMAQAVGITPVENGKPPIENDLARFGVFANQALTMGISGEQTDRVVREVKGSPEGTVSQATRTELVEQLHSNRNMAWNEANSEVDHLENGARMLPNEISAYGTMNIPTASALAPALVINLAPQIDVRPNVQVTVEANNDSAYAEGLKDQASMTGSQAILSDSSRGQEEE
jgi:hypothetical protein